MMFFMHKHSVCGVRMFSPGLCGLTSRYSDLEMSQNFTKFTTPQYTISLI